MSRGGNPYHIVAVPSLNEANADVNFISDLFAILPNPNVSIIFLKFDGCRFLGPFAVAALGAFLRTAYEYGKPVIIQWSTISRRVYTNLCQNGFAGSFGQKITQWSGNSVPYKEYRAQDLQSVFSYLHDRLLKRDWVLLDDDVKEAISGRLWEIFANAFEHSKSLVGVFTCGQQYPIKKQLILSVVDIGVGIPNKVRQHFDNHSRIGELRDHSCLQWAFESGNSTAATQAVRRGLGLDLLREFVRINDGSLEIFSGRGYAVADRDGLRFEELGYSFPGTVVNIRMVCDGREYKFAR